MRGLLLLGLASKKPKYSARRSFFGNQLRKIEREDLYYIELENRVSETTAIAPSDMLDRAFVSEQQWGSGLESVLLSLPTRYWLVYQRRRVAGIWEGVFVLIRIFLNSGKYCERQRREPLGVSWGKLFPQKRLKTRNLEMLFSVVSTWIFQTRSSLK